MAGDFNKPSLADNYTAFAQAVRNLCAAIAMGLDGTSTSNIPSGAIRWNSSNSRWEKYNGSVWNALATKFNIDVDTVDGLHGSDLALVGHNHTGTYQPLDAELTAIAGLVSSANTLAYFTGSGAAALTNFTAFARTFLDDADATAVQATLGLTPGTNVQAYSAKLKSLADLTSVANLLTLSGLASVENLTAIAGITGSANKMVYFTGAGALSLTDVTSQARTFLAASTAASQRDAIGACGTGKAIAMTIVFGG